MNIQYPVLRRNGQLKYGNYPNKIILHHPVFNGTPEALNEMEITNVNDPMTMSGYNFYVRKDGSVYAMRPIEAIGANCYGQNACSIGIAFEGNFMIDTMPDEQFNAGVELCKYLMEQYSSVKEIGPHKKYYNTACPGVNFPVDKMINAAMNSTTIVNVPESPQTTNLFKLWDSGAAVKSIQEKLIKLDYNLGSSGADSIFGQYTYNAVEDFQSKHSLIVDGVVGTQTLESLDKAIAAKSVVDITSIKYLQHEIQVKEDNIPGPITLSKCTLVNLGAQGNIVKWIQAKLSIRIDGAFGNQTKIAVQNFQAKNGLTADGIVGQNTWIKLLGL